MNSKCETNKVSDENANVTGNLTRAHLYYTVVKNLEIFSHALRNYEH